LDKPQIMTGSSKALTGARFLVLLGPSSAISGSTEIGAQHPG